MGKALDNTAIDLEPRSSIEAIAAEVEERQLIGRWSKKLTHIQSVIRLIEEGHINTPQELVAWDAEHGRRLFTWNTAEAAESWRVHEARLFFNRFRTIVNGMRMRLFINVPGSDKSSSDREYKTSESIADDVQQRAWVIDDLSRRIEVLGSELRVWSLTVRERRIMFKKFRIALGC